MKIVSLSIELIRVSTAVAEFEVRVELDGPTAGCQVEGRVVGPRCAGISTVEVAYSLVPVGMNETSVTLKGVIPEPNLWAPEAPFRYVVTVELLVNGEEMDSRVGVLAFRGQQ